MTLWMSVLKPSSVPFVCGEVERRESERRKEWCSHCSVGPLKIMIYLVSRLGWSTFFKGLFMNKKQLGAQIEKLGEQKRQGRSKDRVSAKVPAGRPAGGQTNKDESVHPSQEDIASFRDPLKLHAQIFEQNRMLDLNSDSSSDIYPPQSPIHTSCLDSCFRIDSPS